MDVKLHILELLPDDPEDDRSTKYRIDRQSYWIHKFRTLTPQGINIHT